MLVLSRKLNEVIVIDGNIRITVVGIRGNQVRLGVEAPLSVPILRKELCPFDRPNGVDPCPTLEPEWGGEDSPVMAVPASPEVS